LVGGLGRGSDEADELRNFARLEGIAEVRERAIASGLGGGPLLLPRLVAVEVVRRQSYTRCVSDRQPTILVLGVLVALAATALACLAPDFNPHVVPGRDIEVPWLKTSLFGFAMGVMGGITLYPNSAKQPIRALALFVPLGLILFVGPMTIASRFNWSYDACWSFSLAVSILALFVRESVSGLRSLRGFQG
jgi:hypothetical protein